MLSKNDRNIIDLYLMNRNMKITFKVNFNKDFIACYLAKLI